MAVIGLMRTVLREDAIFRGWKKKKKEKKKNRSCIFIFSLFRFCFFWRRSIDFSLEIPSILLLLLLSIEHITVRFLFSSSSSSFFSLLFFLSSVDSSDFELVYDCYFLEIVAINNAGFVST